MIHSRNDDIVCWNNADAEGKYWLDAEAFEAIEAHAYGMSPSDRRIVKSIIYQHFDYILSEWQRFQELKNG